MMHPNELAIAAYADDEAGELERAEIERHLAVCTECRGLADDLRTIRRQAAALEPMTPPDRVWPRIESSIRRPEAAASARHPAFPWWSWIGAAAILLIAVAGGFRLVGPSFRPTPATSAVKTVDSANAASAADPANAATAATATSAATAASAAAEAGASVPRVESELRQSEQHYHTAITGLERIARAEQGALDRRTAATLRTNLSVIDQAIKQSRAALDTQPHSEAAQQSLLESFRAKVSLLQDTIALINEVRKGNETGAAQIASGLNHKR